MGPIKTSLINFKKCALLHNRLLIGVDFGFSLTKFIFVNKKNKDQLNDESCDHVTFQEALFKKEDFESAIQWLKENAYVPENTTFTLHGTGVGFAEHKERIEVIFGLKSVFVNEGLAIAAGHKIAFEQIGVENLKRPIVENNLYGNVPNDMINKMMEAIKKKMNKNDNNTSKSNSPFPCLLCFCGSVLSINYFDENGVAEQIGGIQPGGQTFLGMAKCMLDTNNYDEVIELAKMGNQGNVDILMRDMLGEDPNSPYGKFPKELPLLSFGKIAEIADQLELYSKEDVALSLVAYACSMYTYSCLETCILKNVNKMYLSGNTFQSDLFQKNIRMGSQFFSFGLEYIFVDVPFCTALGAMFCTYEDMKTYKKQLSIYAREI